MSSAHKYIHKFEPSFVQATLSTDKKRAEIVIETLHENAVHVMKKMLGLSIEPHQFQWKYSNKTKILSLTRAMQSYFKHRNIEIQLSENIFMKYGEWNGFINGIENVRLLVKRHLLTSVRHSIGHETVLSQIVF